MELLAGDEGWRQPARMVLDFYPIESRIQVHQPLPSHKSKALAVGVPVSARKGGMTRNKESQPLRWQSTSGSCAPWGPDRSTDCLISDVEKKQKTTLWQARGRDSAYLSQFSVADPSCIYLRIMAISFSQATLYLAKVPIKLWWHQMLTDGTSAQRAWPELQACPVY